MMPFQFFDSNPICSTETDVEAKKTTKPSNAAAKIQTYRLTVLAPKLCVVVVSTNPTHPKHSGIADLCAIATHPSSFEVIV